MNIRKFIKESIERVLMQEKDGAAIVGADILNHFPFDKLPENREQVDWNNRGVNGWGDVHVPSVDAHGLSTMLGKDDVMAYLRKFSARFGEEPMFVLNPTGLWFDKIKVVNPKYIEAETSVTNAIKQFGTEGD